MQVVNGAGVGVDEPLLGSLAGHGGGGGAFPSLFLQYLEYFE